MNIGIKNVTNVPAPKTSFGFAQNIQQNIAQNDQLSAFLSEISKLDEGNWHKIGFSMKSNPFNPSYVFT